MLKACHIIIYGRVQGVGFRFSCMEQAYKNNIKGFARNKSNGAVYILAEGEENDIEDFLTWCEKGPIWADIEQVEVAETELKNYKSFDIK